MESVEVQHECGTLPLLALLDDTCYLGAGEMAQW